LAQIAAVGLKLAIAVAVEIVMVMLMPIAEKLLLVMAVEMLL